METDDLLDNLWEVGKLCTLHFVNEWVVRYAAVLSNSLHIDEVNMCILCHLHVFLIYCHLCTILHIV